MCRRRKIHLPLFLYILAVMKKAYLAEGKLVPIFFQVGKPKFEEHEGGIMYSINNSMTPDDTLELVLASLDMYHGDETYLDAFKWAIDATDYLWLQLEKSTK
jgi:hypothetical protein